MKLIIIGVLFYLLYKTVINPRISNQKLIDTNQWSEEEEEYIDYEEVED